ncbi:putative uncharacterized protein DDB_G0271606 [Cajanus cajan]|uniref:putative uncharacterized protein DDB_G0271606 n=1 Tax=Cajanus cajan TaxID=3821 RepID=UPI00098DAFDE|nr:putative uncharacterized protein DDB_G0271606 [Cajanus cajan]
MSFSIATLSDFFNYSIKGVENPHNLPHHPQMVPYATHHETDPHHPHLQHQSIKHGYPNYSSSKTKQPQQQQQQSTLSDEDEPGGDEDPKRKVSPWQRMKWTDTMVRLLIMAVYYIGDEAGSEGSDKKKSSGLMQKKGKWKSVSRAMMEKGFYVSPQQCEDKFNDLNKRYKRVNDILGKGTACRVVENQSLLDTMDLSPKMKEEVKKLLNSKHLFFREMCAYHNSCGHGNNSNVPQQGESGGEVSQSQAQPQPQPHQQQQQQQQQQRCFHSSENMVGNLGGLRMLKVGNGEEEDEEEEEEDESEDDSDEDEDDSGEGGSRGQVGHGHEDENDGRSTRKRARKGVSMSPHVMQQLNAEVSGVFQDGGRSAWDKKQWMRGRIMQLEEQQLSYQTQAFELEKQRLKWARFSSKKEREMERAKLENERRRLENERMVLLIRQKEIELMSHQHQHQQQQQQQQHSST